MSDLIKKLYAEGLRKKDNVRVILCADLVGWDGYPKLALEIRKGVSIARD